MFGFDGVFFIMDGEIHDVVVGKSFKFVLFCCFYVLILRFLVLAFDGVALIKEAVCGKVVAWSLVCSPIAAEVLVWFGHCS